MKGLALHVGLLVVASGLAIGVWNREELPPGEAQDQVTVWAGSPSSLNSVHYESKDDRIFDLVPKEDAIGRYYVGSMERNVTASVMPGPDGGAPPPPKRETVRFIGVKAADEFVKSLVPLKALRTVGKLEGTKAEDFGLDKPSGTLKVKIGGKEHSLVVGGLTPGGGEYYAKAPSGEIYPIANEIVQTLQFADSRLMERELHGFQATDVTVIRVSKDAKSREFARVPDKINGWAEPATPTKLDETAGNWMSKLSLLRPTEYVEKPAKVPSPADLVVRVEYFSGPKSLGYFELFHAPGSSGKEYLVRTEYIRWYAKVLSSSAEQLEHDLSSVLK